MATTQNVLTPHYDCFFDSAAPAERARPRPPQPSSSGVRTSHYRPFSTLQTESPYIQPKKLKRSSSIGGLHFASMGLNFTGGKDKGKGKEEVAPPQASSSSRLPPLVSEFGMFKTPMKPKTPKSPLSTESFSQRPSTSTGTPARASPAPSSKSTFFRMKKKRSMASIFSSSSNSADGPSTIFSSPDQPGSPASTNSSSSVGTTVCATTPTSSTFASPHVTAASSKSDSGATIKTSGHNKGGGSSNADTDGGSADVHLDSSPGDFVPKTNWAMRHNMTMHPYQNIYPYMRSYDPVLLESDRYTDILLQHLSQGAPSFHDYKRPPATVLDLGCGVGHWALYAANIWQSSEITGFDMVNIVSPAFEATENVHFVQGTFIGGPLPFANDSFEFVRMANLILCIPQQQWAAVLAEVHRVLAPGGRLEVIDDEIHFPYAPKPRKLRQKKLSVSSFDDSDSDTYDNLFEDSHPNRRRNDDDSASATTFFSETSSRPTSYDSKGSNNSHQLHLHVSETVNEEDEDQTGLSESVTVRPISAMKGGEPMVTFLPPTPPVTVTAAPTVPAEPAVATPASIPAASEASLPPLGSWDRQTLASRDMEQIFDMALAAQDIAVPRGNDPLIVNAMKAVFGADAADEVGSFQVELAPVDSPIGQQARARAALEARARSGPGEGAFGFSVLPEEAAETRKAWKMPKAGQYQAGRDARERERDRKTSGGSRRDEGVHREAVVNKRASMDAGTLNMMSSPLPQSLNAKAAARLGLPATTNMKAAHRLGYDITPDKATYSPEKSVFSFTRKDKDKELSKTPMEPHFGAGRAKAVKPPSPVITDDERDLMREDGDDDLASLSHAASSASSSPTSMTMTPNTPTAANPHPNSHNHSHGHGGPNSTQTHTPDGIPVANKAALRLGIPPTTPSEPGTAQQPASGHPLQSPGLLVWPTTYLAMPPVDLEMHACRNVHMLLGCRPAIYEFVSRQVDAEGRRLVSDEEFADAFWEYECFRRTRLNWPSPALDPYDDDASAHATETVKMKDAVVLQMGATDSFNGQFLQSALVHLRTIRVFSAVKPDPDAYSPPLSPSVESPSVRASAVIMSSSGLSPPVAAPMMVRARSDSSRA